MQERVILHCDCNSFFASCEIALNPSLKNVPLAVCGNEEERHGIVLAKNELAKKYNIQTTDTIYQARKKCPSLVIVEPHYDEYIRYSRAVNAIYAQYTDLIEPFGIDESWLDVTGSVKLFGDGYEIAEKIRNQVKAELGITVSVGVSFNKIFAKLGSDYKKPDATTVVSKDNFNDIVYPLPVGDLLFVGKKTAAHLNSMGIYTIGDLARANSSFLTQRLGKMGDMLIRYALGEDDSPVTIPSDQIKSISNGHTFRVDLLSLDECKNAISVLSDEIGTKLRKKGYKCGTVSISIKDKEFVTIQRQMPTPHKTDISDEIFETASQLLEDNWREGRPIRALTVSVHNLVRSDEYSEQICFFEIEENVRQKKRLKEVVVDDIRGKFGTFSIFSAASLKSDKK